MKKGLWVLLTLMLILPVSPALAERAGGTFHYVAPYGGDLLGLDAHKSTRIQDFLVMTSLNRSLYSWEPGVNKPKMELASKVDVSGWQGVDLQAPGRRQVPPRPEADGRRHHLQL
jgi:hypothetical protein